MRRKLIDVGAVAAVIVIPAIVLQRWIAETRWSAILLVAAWMAIVGAAILVGFARRRELRWTRAGTWAAIVLGTVAIGYWTGFRDRVVDEDVAIASTRASGVELQRALTSERAPASTGPRELERGTFAGADGHAGEGLATILELDGRRVLTFRRFDVDPGVDVEVLLSTRADDVDDRVELGRLKGNVGDQQYEIPADVDLREYRNVVLWCVPFTVRIAVAELGG